MNGMNRVSLMGNLTRDPELRSLKTGGAVCSISLAINDSYRNKEGETVETVCFVDVSVWGKQADNCDKYLKKGGQVVVEGKLKLDQWTTDAGDKRSRLKVQASRVHFVGGAPKRSDSREREPAF